MSFVCQRLKMATTTIEVDMWNELQAFIHRQTALKEKFRKRRRFWQKTLETIAPGQSLDLGSAFCCEEDIAKRKKLVADDQNKGGNVSFLADGSSRASGESIWSFPSDPALENAILKKLTDLKVDLPITSEKLCFLLEREGQADRHSVGSIEQLLRKLELQKLICLKDGKKCELGYMIVESADHEKICALCDHSCVAGTVKSSAQAAGLLTAATASSDESSGQKVTAKQNATRAKKKPEKSQRGKATTAGTAASSSNGVAGKSRRGSCELSVEALLALQSVKERETQKMGIEILELLNRPTAKERALVERFRTAGGSKVQEFCSHGTKEDCQKMSQDNRACARLHFRKIVQKHTDISLGDCSFLNTCFHMDSCKYIHYEVDYGSRKKKNTEQKGGSSLAASTVVYPAQWIQCDLRKFDLSVLGKFAVVMADPPWDIHMELPYGTMSDDEMRALNVQCLSDDGVIFLWVTGRAMELGRQCLALWGYTQCDELIWVKTNQLQRIIRTGRTGHWLNHGKEHCLVGVKGSIERYNRYLDGDVIVAEVRATSHKPDEIYGLIERLSPGTRKVELFGRMHNAQPNWITLGNQLDGVRLLDPGVVAQYTEQYPIGASNAAAAAAAAAPSTANPENSGLVKTNEN